MNGNPLRERVHGSKISFPVHRTMRTKRASTLKSLSLFSIFRIVFKSGNLSICMTNILKRKRKTHPYVVTFFVKNIVIYKILCYFA